MKIHRILSLAALFVGTLAVSAQAPAAPQKSAAVTTAAAAANTGAPLDINTATPDQIKKLPGIGDAYTKRIIDGRPYAAKTQLVSRGILPKATYDGIASLIIAKRTK